MIRAYREAENARSVHFITFTYTEDDVPVAMSLYRVDTDTGQMVRISDPQILERSDSTYEVSRGNIVSQKLGPRVWSFPVYRAGEPIDENKLRELFSDKAHVDAWNMLHKQRTAIPDGEYIAYFTTALCPRDVRLAIKRFRTDYKRNHKDSPIAEDFRYLLVGEYGMHNTMRPHYHMLCYNLTDAQAQSLADQWPYGDVQVKAVTKTNKDGSNGFQLVARYLGKYSAKGSFNSPAYLAGFVPRTRMCASRGFGTSGISQEMKDYILAKDIATYDEWNLREIQDHPRKYDIIRTIRSRLKYSIPILVKNPTTGVKQLKVCEYAMPLSLVRKIFDYSYKNGYASWNSIYYLVKDVIRDEIADLSHREFKEFIDQHGTEDLSLACAAFDRYKKDDLLAREAARRQNHINFYNNSKF